MWQPSVDVQNICVNEERIREEKDRKRKEKQQKQINKQLSKIIIVSIKRLQ